MKTLALLLIALRLAGAAPTPPKADVTASRIPGATDKAGESARESISKIDLADTGHCCLDAARVANKACDVPLCLKNFFNSEPGKAVAEAILEVQETSPNADVPAPSSVKPIPSKGRTGKREARKANVVKADGDSFQLSGTGGEVFATFGSSDLAQCTVLLLNDGNFGSDAPLCQQLILDHVAPKAGCAHRKAGKDGSKQPPPPPPPPSSVKKNAAGGNVVKGRAHARKVGHGGAELKGN